MIYVFHKFVSVKSDTPSINDFIVDKITNSIENAVTGEVFNTEVMLLTNKERKEIKKADWQFNWHDELKKSDRQVYKLVTVSNDKIVHGLISVTDNSDHIYLHLIESAKFNKGKGKMYKGVPANLVAFACKVSFELGYSGVIAFVAKSQLIDHYKIMLGAKVLVANRMYIDTKEAKEIVRQYFKSFEP